MSDCANGGRRVYNVPTHSPAEDRLETVLHFVGDSFPRMFVINRLGREVDYVTVDGERYERVRETCVGIMDDDGWFICDNCGCQTKGDQYGVCPNYCANCGERVSE